MDVTRASSLFFQQALDLSHIDRSISGEAVKIGDGGAM